MEEKAGRARQEPPTVLVVDDDERNRLLLEARLSPHYRVVTAACGPEALARIRGEPAVDLVLLDVMMPGMSGLEVCRTVKAEQRRDYLPVLLVTALGEHEDRLRGLDAGADDFLTKPVDATELLLRVRAFLHLREQHEVIRRQLAELRRLATLKDDLFSLIVHDLRNPLLGGTGHIELLRMKLDAGQTDGLRQDAAAALQSLTTLSGMIEEILEIRTLEAGALQLRAERTRLAEVAEQALATVAGAARRRDVPLELARLDDPVFPLDSKLVRRSVENLLVNAIKYSPRGRPVKMCVRAAEAGGAVEVSDEGPGVPDDLKQEIFERFGSVEARRNQERCGYGLGLYLVSLVARAHGGRVAVLDRRGGGSMFRLELGAAAPPSAARGPA